MRKLLVMGVLQEDTYRQDNEYGNVASRILVNPGKAAALRHVLALLHLPMCNPWWQHAMHVCTRALGCIVTSQQAPICRLTETAATAP